MSDGLDGYDVSLGDSWRESALGRGNASGDLMFGDVKAVKKKDTGQGRSSGEEKAGHCWGPPRGRVFLGPARHSPQLSQAVVESESGASGMTHNL